MIVITVKEYAEQENISEAGVRKKVAKGFPRSVIVDGNTYIVIEDKSIQIIKDLKAKVRLQNSRIKTLKAEAIPVQTHAHYIKRLEDRADKFEELYIEATKKRDETYENVINTYLLPK